MCFSGGMARKTASRTRQETKAKKEVGNKEQINSPNKAETEANKTVLDKSSFREGTKTHTKQVPKRRINK